MASDVALATVCPGAVTTTVVPLVTIVAGAPFVRVGLDVTETFGFGVAAALALAPGLESELESESDDEEPDEPCILVTALLVPVKYTDQKFDPPPKNS